MNDIINKFRKLKIIPVVTINKTSEAEPLAKALTAGGLPCAEITLRTDSGLDAIRLLSKNSSLLLGAGTILTVDQASAARDAGAQFVVSPGFNPKVVRHCQKLNIPIFPGISNPTDIEMALEAGLTHLKFFPAEAYGGVKTLKALGAPYHMVNFIPTGGITEDNINDYLGLDTVIACGGSWMVKSEWLENNRFDKVLESVEIAVKKVGSHE